MGIDNGADRDHWQEYKDDLAQGHIYPDGTQREPDWEPTDDYDHLAYNPATDRQETGGDEIQFADEAPF